ncbi:hypothetical protein [Bifidobacterium sp. ESL0790]|uniref:hypothetical protein n=1 Tax=Bifidobacterium sp. ESL0790 TaxID=2983233 RepID=UPI0023F63CCA|nr:hypothetical protein [Bifidobacterium sp. ESL0790]WEV71680.1 hypothetical protein OZY47_04195 [Bifidobacterium sp. ESL0790]
MERKNRIIQDTSLPMQERLKLVGYDVPNLNDLFKDYHGTYRGEEWDTGCAVGAEIQ